MIAFRAPYTPFFNLHTSIMIVPYISVTCLGSILKNIMCIMLSTSACRKAPGMSVTTIYMS